MIAIPTWTESANPAAANPTQSPTHSYSYDPAGNRTSSLAFGQNTSYTSSSVNAYTSISGGGFQPPSPTYDPNGNTLTLPRPDGVSQSLTWDIHNRLRTASSIHDPQSSISNVYDPLGRLVWTRTTTTGQPATDEIWSWSGWTLLTREVLQGSTAIDTFRYTWGPDLSNTLEGAGGVGGLLAIEHAAGSSTTWDIRHAHYDANGNVIALSSETGAISARYRYSPFGELITSEDLDSSGWNERNIHLFSTKPEVPGTGLLYYGYRWYDPATGRWPSRDPIEEEGGVNLYGFVGNNSISNKDILGLKKWICKWGGKTFVAQKGNNALTDSPNQGTGEADTFEEAAKAAWEDLKRRQKEEKDFLHQPPVITVTSQIQDKEPSCECAEDETSPPPPPPPQRLT